MKILRTLLVLLIIQFFIGQVAVYAETIYTKKGSVIKAKVTEKSEDTIWYEIVVADDIVEYIGIDISEVEKILNDDGSISEYSPTYSESTTKE